MEVFISWSGSRSKYVAEALRKWLKHLINAVDPWLSVSDIEKGARWRESVALRLKTSHMGIICLTPGNLKSEWLLFEAGALSKAMDTAHVCPVLVDLEPSDVTGPLAQFQATRATKDEIRALVRTINAGLGDARRQDTELDEAFEVWWPKLERQLETLPPDEARQEPRRSERDILDEVLQLVRDQNRNAAKDAQSFAPSVLEYRIQKELLRVRGVDGVLIERAPDGASLLIGIQFDDSLNIPSTSFAVPIVLDKTVQAAISQVRDCIRESTLQTKGRHDEGGINLFESAKDVPF